MPEGNQRTWIIVGLVAAAAAALYVFWRKSQQPAQTADTTTAGGVAPGYGTQLGDLIQFTPGDMSGQAGGPGGVSGGASGGQISPTITQGSAPSPILTASRQAPPPRPAQRVLQTGPGGVQSIPYSVIGRQAPAPQPAVRPAPTATQPRQTVSTVLRSGLRAGGGSGSSVSQAIGVLGMGSASPSRVANAPVAGSVPPRNLPAGVSVNNARRLGL